MTCPAADAPSFPCKRMRRLEARLSDRRSRVSNSNRLGNTENWDGRKIVMADNSTSTLTVMLAARNMSSRTLGNGTSMMKIRPTTAIGMIHSATAFFDREGGAEIVMVGFEAIIYFCAAAEPAFWVCDARVSARQIAAKISATTA